jgi:hypothetical protein
MSTSEFKEKRGLSGSTLSYRHLSYRVDARGKSGGSKLLLDDVSVTLRAGELLAIMVRRTRPNSVVASPLFTEVMWVF